MKEKNVLNKMYASEVKVELAEVKVELALFDDIKSNIEGALKMQEEIKTNFAKANGGLRYCDAFDKLFLKALSMAKEVGFEVPSEVMKLQDKANEYRQFFLNVQKLG